MKAAPSTAAATVMVETDDDVERKVGKWPEVVGEYTQVGCFRGDE